MARQCGEELEGRPIEQVDVRQMAGIIAAQPAVKGVDVYTEQSGTMHIGVAQRRPVMRIALGEEGDVLLSGDMQFIPADLYPPQYLPVVTGEALAAGDAARDEKNLLFLGKLINFVESLNADPLWSSEIVQIVVHESSVPWGEPEVELVPATGRYTILMGELDDTQRKLEKLALMYRNVLPHEGWDTYAVLDARYDNQVVCRK